MSLREPGLIAPMGHERTPRNAIVSKRVLLVDDDPDVREGVSELIEGLGHQCVTAGSGTEALETLETFAPHVIVVDIDMPDMTGFELARAIRRLYGSDVAIIAASGRSAPSDIACSLRSGIDLHLVKPVSCDRFRQVIRDSTATSRTPACTRSGTASRAYTRTRPFRR